MSRASWDRSLTAVTTALVVLSWAHIARADAVLDWNAIAVNTVSTASPPRPGPVGFLDMAVVQAAVYDAVQAIDGKFKPYHVQIPGASGSPEAAAAKAAHDVLVQIFPAQVVSSRHRLSRYLAKRRRRTIRGGGGPGSCCFILAPRAGRRTDPLPPPFTAIFGPVSSARDLLPASAASGALAATPVGAVLLFHHRRDQFRAKPRRHDPVNSTPPLGGAERWAPHPAPVQADRAHYLPEKANNFVLLAPRLFGTPLPHVNNIGIVPDCALANLAIADAVITVW